MKALRGDAYDGERVLVEINSAANYVRITVQAVMPKSMAQDDIRRRVWSVLIICMKEPAHFRLDSEQIEIVPRSFIANALSYILVALPCTDARKLKPIGSHTEKGAVAVTIGKIIRVRLRVPSRRSARNLIQILRMRHIQRL